MIAASDARRVAAALPRDLLRLVARRHGDVHAREAGRALADRTREYLRSLVDDDAPPPPYFVVTQRHPAGAARGGCDCVCVHLLRRSRVTPWAVYAAARGRCADAGLEVVPLRSRVYDGRSTTRRYTVVAVRGDTLEPVRAVSLMPASHDDLETAFARLVASLT